MWLKRDLERVTRVVNSGMDDFAVAGTGAGAESGSGFDDHDFSALERQLSGHRDSHRPRPNHHAVQRFPRRFSLYSHPARQILGGNPSPRLSCASNHESQHLRFSVWFSPVIACCDSLGSVG